MSSGYGSGDGDGSGSGSGSGSRYGYGYQLLQCFAPVSGAVLAFWRSDADGRPANGGKGEPVQAGDVQTVEGPLSICTKHALHGTTRPDKWKGARWWVVALAEPVQRQDDKIASLTRTIVCELT